MPKETKWELEELSEKIHKLYCEQYKKDNKKDYWTKGDYSKLDEKTKEYDRNIARFISNLLSKQKKELIEEFIKLADTLESEHADTEYNEWRAFKGFRNVLRDKLKE